MDYVDINYFIGPKFQRNLTAAVWGEIDDMVRKVLCLVVDSTH